MRHPFDGVITSVETATNQTMKPTRRSVLGRMLGAVAALFGLQSAANAEPPKITQAFPEEGRKPVTEANKPSETGAGKPTTKALGEEGGAKPENRPVVGKIKSVNADKNTLTITVGDKDRDITITDDTKLLNKKGEKLEKGLKNDEFKKDATVSVTLEKTKDGKEICKEIKVGIEMPKPADVNPLTGAPEPGESGGKPPKLVTTQALGEEGGKPKMTDKAGEDGGIPKPPSNTTAFGEDGRDK